MYFTLQDVASGLDYLHEKMNVLHGDLKPANILAKGMSLFNETCKKTHDSVPGDTFKICDFGTTLKLDENRQCGFDNYCTTEPFMPPEAVHEYYETIDEADRFLSPGADMWQLGLTLFEACGFLLQ